MIRVSSEVVSMSVEFVNTVLEDVKSCEAGLRLCRIRSTSLQDLVSMLNFTLYLLACAALSPGEELTV